MYILGISGGFRAGNMDAAACLVYKNKIVAASEEERFIRIKHAAGYMPKHAIRYCLRRGGIRIKDVDALVFAGATYTDIHKKIKRYFDFKFGFCPPLYLVEHHLAHASSAFYISGFENANILTMDLSGDGISTFMAYGNQAAITKIKEPEIMKTLAISLGVPDASIVLEEKAANTYENVAFTAAILKDKKWNRILLVSSPYHMLRAILVFKRHSSEITVISSPVTYSLFYSCRDSEKGKLFLKQINLTQIRGIIHEYLGIIYYWSKGWI